MTKTNKFSPMRQKNKMRNEPIKLIFSDKVFSQYMWDNGYNQYLKHYVTTFKSLRSVIDYQYINLLRDNKIDINNNDKYSKIHKQRLMEAFIRKCNAVIVLDEPLRMRHVYLEGVSNNQLKIIRQLIKNNAHIKITIYNYTDRKLDIRSSNFSRLYRYIKYEINGVEVDNIEELIEKYKNGELKCD